MPHADPIRRREYDKEYKRRNKSRTKEYDKRYRARHAERISKVAEQWRESNKERIRAYWQKRIKSGEHALWQRTGFYGITPEQYDDMLVRQDNLCAVCGKIFDAESGPCVDHDHVTVNVRGLVHRKCNMLMGMANDDPRVLEAAAQYLRSHS